MQDHGMPSRWAQIYIQVVDMFFEVSLTVRLSISLVTDQLNAPILVL